MSKFAEFSFEGVDERFITARKTHKKAKKKLSFKVAKKPKTQPESRVSQEDDRDALTPKSISNKRPKKVVEKSVQKSVEQLLPLEFLLPFDSEGNIVPFPFYQQDVLLPPDQLDDHSSYLGKLSSLSTYNFTRTSGVAVPTKRKSLTPSPESYLSDEDDRSEQLTPSSLSQRSDDSLRSPSMSQPQIRKVGFQKALAESLHVQLPKHFLVDITEQDLLVVGRPKTHGSTKLHCHIIPFAFVKHMIKALIKESADVKELTEKLSALVIMAAKSQKGFAIKSSDLEREEYSAIKPKISQHSDRVIKGQEEEVFLASPGKQGKIFSTPSKMQKAAQEFTKYNLEFIASALRDISSVILDHNTSVLFSEILSRYVFELLNSGENVVFAKEGNTLRYEIRLYNDEEDASCGNTSYKVVSSRELRALCAEAGEKIYSKVRIVDAEGPHVKAACSAIDQLNKILLADSNLQYVEDYNNYYNLTLILANYPGDLAVYNDSLNALVRIDSQIANHLAKTLYCCLDLKALENVVFVPSRKKGHEVMVGAKGTRKVKYAFKSGEDYRDEEMERAICREEFLRTASKSKEILPSKLAELFLIGTTTFSSYFKTHEEFKALCLGKLIEIAFKDYGIIEAEQMMFINQTKEVLDSFNIDLLPHHIGSPQLRLMGEEIGLREYLNGFSSDSSPSPSLGGHDSSSDEWL